MEKELGAIADAIPKILWCRYFMDSKGCYVEDVYIYIYQDN